METLDFQVTLSFEGLYLKGYCAVHDCPPEEGPVEVELSCTEGLGPPPE